MSILQHWVLSWSVALYVAFAIAGGGLIASWLLPQLSPYRLLAKGVGFLFLVIAIYLAGYQSADDYADQARKLAAEQEKTRMATFERDSAHRDLALQKLATENARAERDQLAQSRTDLQQKVADYEAAERSSPAPAPNCVCDGSLINDRDVRWRRGLQPTRK